MLAATLLALGSAALHATWNLLVKVSRDRLLAGWGQFLVGGILFAPVLLITGPPGWDVAPYLVASSLIHVLYLLALTRAYHHGDFSLAYPLARGGGALVAAAGGVLFLDDHLSGLAWLAIAVIVLGLVSLVRPGTSRVALLWAGLTAATIGTYTTVDAAGARDSNGFGYAAVLMLGIGVALTLVLLGSGRRPRMAPALRAEWRRFVVGGLCTAFAYAMVLAAVRLAPVGYVAALRESSVVLAALAGWLFLHERLGRARLVSSGVVAFGLVLLVVWR